MTKRKKKTEKIKIKIGKLKTGHKPHTTGSGPHDDKRLKRQKTREKKNKSSIEEQKEREHHRD